MPSHGYIFSVRSCAVCPLDRPPFYRCGSRYHDRSTLFRSAFASVSGDPWEVNTRTLSVAAPVPVPQLCRGSTGSHCCLSNDRHPLYERFRLLPPPGSDYFRPRRFFVLYAASLVVVLTYVYEARRVSASPSNVLGPKSRPYSSLHARCPSSSRGVRRTSCLSLTPNYSSFSNLLPRDALHQILARKALDAQGVSVA